MGCPSQRALRENAERAARARSPARALTVNAETGGRPWVAHTLYGRGRMVGDGQALADAVAAYPELGMTAWAERASKLAESLGVLGAPSS